MKRAASALRLGALALVLLAAGPAQAAEQPAQAPPEFRNGESNAFGSVTMVPYLDVGGGTPIQARFVLHDLGTLQAAHAFLFAFNVKGDGAVIALDSLETAAGATIPVQRSVTVDGGRQPQVHVAPGDLLAVARDGRVELALRGHIEAQANGQVHVGAMAIAFDAAWKVLSASDGPAQVYGFTMAMATGLPGGAMPFQGKGNTWMALPFVLLAAVVLLAGNVALHASHRAPQALVALPESFKVPGRGRPRRVAGAGPPAAAPGRIVRPSNGAGNGTASRTQVEVPVFGGPGPGSLPRPEARPSTLPKRPASPLATGPLQGPLLPGHLARNESTATPMLGATRGDVAAVPRAAAPRGEARPAVRRAKSAATPKAPRPSSRPSPDAAARSSPRARPHSSR